jgi:hypothetical protein
MLIAALAATSATAQNDYSNPNMTPVNDLPNPTTVPSLPSFVTRTCFRHDDTFVSVAVGGVDLLRLRVDEDVRSLMHVFSIVVAGALARATRRRWQVPHDARVSVVRVSALARATRRRWQVPPSSGVGSLQNRTAARAAQRSLDGPKG